MSGNKSSYEQVLKVTSIFGGVEVFKILIRVIRAKFVAVLLGPGGLGIASLLGSTIGLIASLTNFGLATSAVKDVAAAAATKDQKKISRVVIVLRKLVWLTGLLGSVMTFAFSKWLSQLTFGNEEYTLHFVLISITLLFNQLSSGQGVVLRGLRKIKYLVQASMIGSVLGLVTNIPLYYFFGEDGIVPGIILTSITTLLLTYYYSRKVNILKFDVSFRETINEGKQMLNLGLVLSLNSIITLGAAYILKIFISNTGSIEDVGFYNAGFSIITSYVGMVFTAMGKDYFPRLSAVHKDIVKIKKTVTEQAVIALLILIPIIVIFLIYSPIMISLLYSRKFLPIEYMIIWAIMGMLFKALSWAIGFVIIAKNDTKLFARTSVGFNTVFLFNNIIGFYYGGLEGLGISFLINYFIHFIALILITKYRYSFAFNTEIYKIMVVGIILTFLSFILSYFSDSYFQYLTGIILVVVSSLFSIYELNQRVDIKRLFKKLTKKKN